MPVERLQKILSRAGVASRRKAEEMIREGRVTLNGQTIRELGTKADLERDHIKADGKLVRPPKNTLYLALNKPKGYVTTMSDPEGRPKIADLLRGVRERVYPVGRLDFNTEGLLLLTNDGEFANRIMKASSQVPKTYWVKVAGKPSAEHLEKLRSGIRLDGTMTAPAKIRLLREGANPWLEVILIEGRQNQIRRMFSRVGHMVEKLKRVRIGFLELGPLAPGKHRPLAPQEVERFLRLKGKAPFRSREPSSASSGESRERAD